MQNSVNKEEEISTSLEFNKSLGDDKEEKKLNEIIESNLFASCMSSHGSQSVKSSLDMQTNVMKQVDAIIEDGIHLFLTECQPNIEKAEAPFMPMSFTLWRQGAIHRLRRLLDRHQGQINVDEVMHHFSSKVDIDLLRTFSKLMIQQYLVRLKQHSKYVPEDLSKYMDVLSKSQSYQRLMGCLSEWMATMEMCDDLFERIQLYGIAHYIDLQQAEKKIRQTWGIIDSNQQSLQDKAMTHTRGMFTSFVTKLAEKLSSWLKWIGVVGLVQTSVLRWAIGIYFAHPAIFVGSIISALVLQVGGEKMEEGKMIAEIEKITEYFTVATSNLKALYDYASESIVEGFATKDTDKILKAIEDLLEGHGKNNKGSLQKYFDERDEELMKLKSEEGEDDWITIKKLDQKK